MAETKIYDFNHLLPLTTDQDKYGYFVHPILTEENIISYFVLPKALFSDEVFENFGYHRRN